MPHRLRGSIRVVLGSVLAGVAAQPLTACGPSYDCGTSNDQKFVLERDALVQSKTLLDRGVIDGTASGALCESLCGEFFYVEKDSCRLSFDPRALESAEAAEDIRAQEQSLEIGYGGSAGESGMGPAGSPGAAGSAAGGTLPAAGGGITGGEANGNGGSSVVIERDATGGVSSAPSSWLVLVHCTGYATETCIGGRRHVSWGDCENVDCQNPLGAWFARAARNEASSVRSFRALATELRRTPIARRFSRRFRQAAREEIRHARLMEREARRHGAHRPRQEFSPISRERSLRDIAVENAREGCVFETYAALEMHVLAAHAESPEHRALFAQIAEDETQHAELAWELHAAFLEALGPADRREVEAALQEAMRALTHAPHPSLPAEVHSSLGLPKAELSQALRAQLVEQLTAAA